MLDTKTMIEAAFPISGGVHSVADYELRREIGRGGMSVVYEAQDTRTGQEVALKLLTLPPTLTAADADGLVARFEREARTMARLSHPNIIAIHEVGAAQGQHFLAMEFLHGQTLRERLGRSRLTFREAFEILTQVAGALDAVHAAGIVHRDIKPLNVMLLPDGTAKLLDFGIARSREEATITNANAIIGTPSYMAPEQVRGEEAGFATDLWSLGVLGYEMFAGHQPFAGQIVPNVLYQVMNKPPAPAPHLPKALQKVLRRALDKEPARRYRDAAAFVQAINSALPKSVLSEPVSVAVKPARSVPKLSLPKLPALKAPSVPRWAQGTALALLFVSGFGYAFQHQHHEPVPLRKAAVANAVRPPVSSVSAPAALPSPALVPPVMLLPPVRSVPPAVAQSGENTPPPRRLPAAAPVQPSAPEAEPAAPGPHKHLARALGAEEQSPAPDPQSDAPADTAVAAQDTVPVQSRTAQSPDQGPATDQGQGTDQAQGTNQAQGAGQAQSAVQAALPAAGESYDPEAEARLRKSEWSRSDTRATP